MKSSEIHRKCRWLILPYVRLVIDHVYQRIISNDSYAHDEQGVNPGQVRGFDGVLHKLWPLLMPWLAASSSQSRRRESRSR